MSLVPKNWSAFQHYKDRAPAWIKLHRSLLDDYEFSRLPDASRALAPMLWLLASEYENGIISASNEEIAFRLRMTESKLLTALKPLVDKGFFHLASVVLADCKHDAIPEKERELEEQERERGEIDISSVAHATRRGGDDFEKFWKEYPRRGDASNPKKPAREKFERAVKAGADPQVIIAAARRYREIEHAAGRGGTERVAQAVTWLNQHRWDDYRPPPSAIADACPLDPSLPTDAELRARYERKNDRLHQDPPAETAAVLHEGDGADSAVGPGVRH